MNRSRSRTRHAFWPPTALLAVLALLGGCAQEKEILPASEMYAEALQMQEAADYEGAIDMYNEIQSSHPFGPYAQQSLLNLAHLHYESSEFDEAFSAINRFISEYPAHRQIDYAYYLRALSLQKEKPDFLDQLIFDDLTNYSREDRIKAYDAYIDLAEQFPNSRYAVDGLRRADTIVNALAEDEIETALHYLRIGAAGAALRRAADLINRYPNSTALEPALAVMVASLVDMGSQGPLEDSLVSIRESFPGSPYLEPASRGGQALLDYMGFDVGDGDWVTSVLE